MAKRLNWSLIYHSKRDSLRENRYQSNGIKLNLNSASAAAAAAASFACSFHAA